MAFSVVRNDGYSPMMGDLGNLRCVAVDLNVTSYVNPGGETLVPAALGLSRIIGIIPLANARGFVFGFTRSTNKMTIAQDNGTATAAALPEIPNATNFGTVSLLVVGL